MLGLAGESGHWCIVLIIVEHDGSLDLVAEPTRETVPCPKCGELSRRQHSSYLRRPLDLPWRGHSVRLRVHSRRWFCDVPTQLGGGKIRFCDVPDCPHHLSANVGAAMDEVLRGRRRQRSAHGVRRRQRCRR
jgi:transposase